MTVTKVSQAGLSLTEAFSGVLQTNANFVDQVIFGPAVDGRAWNGLWNKASVFSSLMLATIEDEGSNTEINIWDLTQQSAGSPSTTVLATVDLSAAATPTAIAACMGYIIVGSEDGIAIIDPHSGAWAERTVGWPRTLSTSTVPALTNNDVTAVAAGLSSTSPLDPRTGGPLPVFGCAYGTGADVGSLIKYDGNVFDYAGTIGPENVCGFVDDRIAVAQENSGNQMLISTLTIDTITADDWAVSAYAYDGNTQQFFLGANTAATFHNADSVFADTTGLTIRRNDFIGSTAAMQGVSAMINRTFNTGFLINYTKAAWLANSDVTDRSGNSNTLTKTGTITEAAVETSAELNGYSGFNTSNYLGRANDSDFDFGTADYAIMGWFKQSAATGSGVMIEIGNTGLTAGTSLWFNSGVPRASVNDGSTTANFDTGVVPALNVWHQWVYINDQTNDAQRIYIDGVLAATDASSGLGSMTIASSVTRIGISCDDTSNPASVQKYALIRVTTTAPTATQVRQMYDAEKGMFVASAECLLQSGSTDAVLDVDIDPLTSKVLVTQTDAITVFDGLVVDSKPTVNSGTSEKGKLWGDLRSEQNSANAYVTAPATDQRQVNEMVRGLASELPKGPDLSKAKAWISFNGTSTIAIRASYNVKSIVDVSTGRYTIHFAVPFKSAEYVAMGSDGNTTAQGFTQFPAGEQYSNQIQIDCVDHAGSFQDQAWVYALFFGELENE
jgi:hypothetical protein